MPRKILKGTVVKDAKDKTISVEVSRLIKHKRYHKMIRKNNKYLAHDELNKCKAGDEVKIVESKPISKLKTWLVLD